MKILEAERLFLKPLLYKELVHINNNEIDKVETFIEADAIFDFVKLAISKKIEKMQRLREEVHPWYTYWLIIDKDNGKGIGFIGFKGLPDEKGYSEVGYSISPNYRKKGLMTEGVKTLVKWAYGFQECKGIVAKVLKTNTGSNKVLNNCNFKLFSSTDQENKYIFILSPAKEKIKVIFFDMGNTLLHFHYGKSDEEKDLQGLVYLTKYLNKFNANINFDEVRRGFYESWLEGIKDRKETHTEYPIENFINSFLKKFQIKLNLAQCIEAVNLFYTDYREQVYFEKDIYDTLKTIKAKGYKIGVISNTCYYDEVMKECFKKAKIHDLIDNYTFSYSLRVGKPKKEIFESALATMKIKPTEAVMVGDSLDSDINPALALGMKTIWFNRKNINGNKATAPELEISCLAEINEYLK